RSPRARGPARPDRRADPDRLSPQLPPAARRPDRRRREMRPTVTTTHTRHDHPVGPIRSTAGTRIPLGLDSVTITGGSWAPYLERNARVSIPHAPSWMDRLGWVKDFRAAG